MQILLQHLGTTLTEIRKELHDISGVALSAPTSCKFLCKHNFSRQRIRYIAAQRHEILRQTLCEILMYKADMFVLVD